MTFGVSFERKAESGSKKQKAKSGKLKAESLMSYLVPLVVYRLILAKALSFLATHLPLKRDGNELHSIAHSLPSGFSRRVKKEIKTRL